MTEPAWDQTLTALTDPDNVMFILVDPDSDEEKLRPPPLGDAGPGIVAAADVQTGAMIAFVPRSEDAQRLAVDGGEPLDQLHTTSIYLGDASTIPDELKAEIVATMVECANGCEPVIANVFGFDIINPGGDEPCLAANVGGEQLWMVQQMITEMAEEGGWVSEDQHAPWLAHITLIYSPDPRTSLTDDVLKRTGPIIFDKIRVAFAGVTTDIPLGDGILQADAFVAAMLHAFHMPGKHNQATHGRGGASSGELAAGERLNAGKSLDMSDPEQAAIAGGIHAWSSATSGSGQGAQQYAQFKGEIADAVHNPHADTRGAQFTRVVAGAPATAPVLHRGMADVPDHQIPHEGDVFDIGPTSFSSDPDVARSFARPAFHDLGAGTMVTMKVSKGSHALRIDKTVAKRFQQEKEHVALGRYHVTGRTEKTVTIRTQDGKSRTVRHVQLELTQVDETMPLTRASYVAPTIDTNELYGN